MIAGLNVPDDAFVCHSCDNPPCVNPAHLFIGTAQDNSDDKEQKGRAPKGEQIPSSKLRSVDIPVIRRRVSNGETQAGVARSFGVTPRVVHEIVCGRLWRHIP